MASFVRWLVQEEETGSPLMLAEKSFSHRGCHSYCEEGFGISKQSNLSQVNNLSERAHVHVGSYVRPSGRGGCTKVELSSGFKMNLTVFTDVVLSAVRMSPVPTYWTEAQDTSSPFSTIFALAAS